MGLMIHGIAFVMLLVAIPGAVAAFLELAEHPYSVGAMGLASGFSFFVFLAMAILVMGPVK